MPVLRPVDLSELLLTLYAASDGEGNWQPFLEHATRCTGADNAALMELARHSGHPAAHYFGIDESAQRSFASHYSAVNPWIPKPTPGAVPLPQGNVVAGESVLPLASLRNTEFYNAWGRTNGVVFTIAANLNLSQNEFLYLCLNRAEKRGPHPRYVGELLTLLVPHLRRIIQMRAPVLTPTVVTSALDSLSIPALIVDSDCRVSEMSPLAQQYLDRADGLTLHHGVAVALPHPGAPDLAHECKAFLAGAAPRSRLLRIPRPGHREFIAYFLKCPRPGRAILLLLDPHAQTPDGVSLGGKLYGLTPSEIALVKTLMETGSLDRAIDLRHITRNTARTQMTSIFRKTGTNRQGQIIRLFSTAVRISQMGDDAARSRSLE